MITRMNAALKRMQQLARDGCRIMDEDKVDALQNYLYMLMEFDDIGGMGYTAVGHL